MTAQSDMNTKKVEIRPGVGLYALFPSLRYTPWVALGEMVDNSIQSYLEHKEALIALHGANYKLRVDINFIGGSNPEIQIVDNAAGIYTKDIARAFTPAMPPEIKSGISQYGIGMKSSACWYSKFFTIKTQALGEPTSRQVTFDIQKIISEELYEIQVEEQSATNIKAHGTRIIMRDLNQPLPMAGAASRVRSYLKSIYRDFLRTGELVLTINNEKLEAENIKYLTAPYWPTDKGPGDGKEIEWVKKFEIELNESFTPTNDNPNPPLISGKIGIMAKGDTKKAGLALVWRRKVVQGAGNLADSPDDLYRPQSLFGSSNAYRKQRLIGELDVSELKVTSFKDAIVWGAGQEEEALRKIREILNGEPYPMLRMAENFRVTENSKPIQAQLEKTLTDVVQTAAAQILSEAGGAIGAQFPAAIIEELPEPTRDYDSIVISKTMVLVPNFERDIVLELKDQVGDMQWLRVREHENQKSWLLTVNRAHPFMQSFTVASPESLEPVLRLALAIGISEIQGKSAGYESPGILRLTINDLLRNYLSSKSDIEISFEE